MASFKSGMFKKWLCLSFGIFIGILLAVPMQLVLPKLVYAQYDRLAGLETVAENQFHEMTFDDVITDELMIPAYEYNFNQPRFFSKYFRDKNPGVYDRPLRKAMEASGSAPVYFDPATYINNYNISETLIDGGLICNNPALYAYLHAKHLLGKS